MANPEQLSLIEKGVAAWNEWYAAHPNAEIDLTGADLRGAQLEGINLNNANLSMAS
jgi:uncharacterized protein YjbI with pentapeptide repeats